MNNGTMFDLPALFERASEHINGDSSGSGAGGDVAARGAEQSQTGAMPDSPAADEWPNLLEASGLGLTFASERQIDQLISLIQDDTVIDGSDHSQHSDRSST